jgi:broad specificity phosphatase PhoE
MTVTRIDLIRHGMPEGGNRIRGHGVDDPLSPLGWAQMRETAAAVDDWHAIVSSPLARCRAFAEWLAAERRLPLAIDPDLREVGFGSWEGLSRDVLRRDHGAEFAAFYDDPVNRRPPGAEPLADFGDRVGAALDRVLADHAGRHTLVVAHAGVIRAAIGGVLQSPPLCWYRTDVTNGALTRLEQDDAGRRLVLHNWRPRIVD